MNRINKNITNFEATCCYSHEMLLPSDLDGLLRNRMALGFTNNNVY
jgi:hypothetical protein